jgi:threonylcarbamoyladenosine tRNA methylthiotransferase MtaB
MNKFFLQTFGCRCNQADSAAIRGSLCRESMKETGSLGEADFVVVNSCTVTHRTDQQVRQAVRRAHRENPQARVIITGCYAERDPETLAAIPGVNLVVGNAGRDRLAEIVAEDLPGSAGRIIRTPLDAARDYLLTSSSQTGGRTRPFVKMQDGCDARCSYCIVPSVRGPGRSARPEEILAEIRTLIDSGYQEIVLTGVHLGTYGRKMATPVSILDLLRRILVMPGLGRLRLSSIEPMRFDRGIVRLAVQHPAFAPHFHIPLQSGSDHILRRMRRPYTVDRFLDLTRLIRDLLPAAGLGTDVLVGFPGESDRDFEETCKAIRQSPLTYLHVFPFSAREGTTAFLMPDQIPPAIIHARSKALREISRVKNLAFRKQFVGRILKGITLAKEEEQGEGVVLTENYIHAHLPKSTVAPNRLVNVRIEEAGPQRTTATLA